MTAAQRGASDDSGGPAEGHRVIPLKPDRLIGVLLDHGVEFIVVGAFAVAAHGHPRGTKDVDICPDPDAENLRRLAAALDELNAEPLDLGELKGEFDRRPDFEGLEAGGNWCLATRLGQLDVMQFLSGLERGYADLKPHAEERDFVGHRVRFCSYEDLIAMKEAAGRDQDLIDVRNLRAARGEL
jgi:hypothetical protein